MNRMIAVVVAIVVMGAALFMIRQNSQQARNQEAIRGIISAGGGTRPSSDARQDARQRQRIGETPAGARFRQMQR